MMKLTRVRPEDFNVEALMAAAREGRLFVDEGKKIVSKEQVKNEVHAYVARIRPLVTPCYSSSVDELWERIFNDDDFLELLTPGNKTDSNSEYVPLAPSKTINGIKGTLLKKRGDHDDHTSLPKYAKTSDMYFRQNKNGVCQGRVYVNHSMTIDFDWSHPHTNKSNGRHFPAGTVHVQVWVKQKDDSFKRLSDSARYMNNKEMKKYGPLIKYFCPDARFR